jgi:hypothetical protein
MVGDHMRIPTVVCFVIFIFSPFLLTAIIIKVQQAQSVLAFRDDTHQV